MDTHYKIYTITLKAGGESAYYVGCTTQAIKDRVHACAYSCRFKEFIQAHNLTTHDLRKGLKYYETTNRSEESRQLSYMKAQHPDWICLNTAGAMYTNNHEESLAANKQTMRRSAVRLMKARYANDESFRCQQREKMKAVMAAKSRYTKSKYSMSYTAAVKHGLWTSEDAKAWRTFEK